MKFYPDNSTLVENKPYYTLKRVFSFNVKFNYITGGRGYGKSYDCRTFVVSRFVKHGEKFAWIRTTDRALEKISNAQQFFGRMKNLSELGVKEYAIKGGIIYINGLEAGYLLSLSTYYNIKGADYNVVNVVYDEFMKADGERGIKNKLSMFTDMIESICRTDSGKIILISNSTDQFDQMLMPFNVKLKEHGIYLFREKNALIHYVAPSKAYTERMLSGAASLTLMSEKDKAIKLENKFVNHGDYGKGIKGKIMFNLMLDDNYYAVLFMVDDKIYIKRDTDPFENSEIYTFNAQHIGNGVKRLPMTMKKVLRIYFDRGKILYSDGYLRDSLISIFQ